jgi:hypothetical protein
MMAIRTMYRKECDFCKAHGALWDSEHAARADGNMAGIQMIHRSFYGNEVWACKGCVRNNDMAKKFAAATAEDRGPVV